MTTPAYDRRSAGVGSDLFILGGDLAHDWWAIATRGALGIAFGLFALFLPGATMLSLVLVFSAYALVSGVFALIAAAEAMRGGRNAGTLIFEGIMNLAAGVVAFL